MKELSIVLGIAWPEKRKFILDNFKDSQMVWPYSIKNAMEYTRIPKDRNTLYLFTELITRSLLISKFKSVVVDEQSLELESIFIWKKIAVEHDYKIKAIIFDVPIEECFPKKDLTSKEIIKNILKAGKKLDQLKQILNMEHQSIIDDFEIVKPIVEEKEDEVL